MKIVRNTFVTSFGKGKVYLKKSNKVLSWIHFTKKDIRLKDRQLSNIHFSKVKISFLEEDLSVVLVMLTEIERKI
jgi:hypothetical protein